MHLLVALLVNAFKLVILPLLLFRRSRAAPKGTWLTVRVDGAVSPVVREPHFWERGERPVSLHALRQAASLAASDARVTGLLVDLRSLQGGSATAMALRDVLEAWKRAGKKVFVYLRRGAGTRQLLVASIADRIIAAPGTEVSPMGFAVEAPYVKHALDKLGLEPEVLARGRYKTAGEFLVSDSMSEAQREQVGRLLDVAWDNLLESLGRGRSVTREEAQRWVDEGPWVASEARERGLIDTVGYVDELLRSLGPDGKREAPTMPFEVYVRRRRISFRPLLRPKRIAVVEVHGAIVSDQPPGWLPMAVESQVCAALRLARETPSIRGVVVHVDSRGGSATASERMLHELRRLAEEKPVVACLGDTAASGGYMVAVGAHAIVSQPTTVTGSIGVVSARVVAGKLAERLGIRTQTVKRGARADMLSPLRHLDDGERTSFDRVMEAIYQGFLEAVAAGRKCTVEDIEPLASGRVWSGLDALEHGLVDRVGGFEEALEEVRSRMGSGAEKMRPVLIAQRRMPSLQAALRSMSLRSGGLERVADLLALSASSGDRVLMWSPWTEVEGP